MGSILVRGGPCGVTSRESLDVQLLSAIDVGRRLLYPISLNSLNSIIITCIVKSSFSEQRRLNRIICDFNMPNVVVDDGTRCVEVILKSIS